MCVQIMVKRLIQSRMSFVWHDKAGTNVLLSLHKDIISHKNRYDHKVTRKTLPSLCLRLLKKAAALDKKRTLILPNKDGSKIT